MTSLELPESAEVARFAFGENWQRFLSTVDERRIKIAEDSLCEMLQATDLQGKRFLDIGCGSGLFSLAARRLGANVFSFDYDAKSVNCALELRRRFRPDDTGWNIQRGSALDETFLRSLGSFDVTYSWGVLHHTGNMWRALELATMPVDKQGLLFISIYNDQHGASRRWMKVKKAYNRLPPGTRALILVPSFIWLWGPEFIRDIFTGRGLTSWRTYHNERGMSPWHDVVDWVGGWPFEVAKPEEIFEFCRTRGFELRRLKTCAGGLGCNEFVFKRS